MRPLWLDYQRPPPGQRRPGLLLLGAGIAVTAVMLANYSSVLADIDAAEEDVARLRRTVQQATPTVPPSETAAADELGYSSARWESLFASLEAASDDSMTLLGLQPRPEEVQISGEAKDVAAAMDYVKRLQDARVFGNVHLTQSEIVTTHPQRPVRFAVLAVWQKGS